MYAIVNAACQINGLNVVLSGPNSKAGKGNRNLTKIIEKQKCRREEKLKDLLAEEKKDSGLVFDELGVG